MKWFYFTIEFCYTKLYIKNYAKNYFKQKGELTLVYEIFLAKYIT